MTDQPLYSTWGFTDSEWGLLVGLPQAVATAASAATHDSARKTRAEIAAGLEKISDGRGSASPLVAGVANAALSQTGDHSTQHAPLRGPDQSLPAHRPVHGFHRFSLILGVLQGWGRTTFTGIRDRPWRHPVIRYLRVPGTAQWCRPPAATWMKTAATSSAVVSASTYP